MTPSFLCHGLCQCGSQLCIPATQIPEKNNVRKEDLRWLIVSELLVGGLLAPYFGPAVWPHIMAEGCVGEKLTSSWQPGRREGGINDKM